MKFIFLSTTIIISDDIDESELPILFGEKISFQTREGKTKFMFKKTPLLEDYILSGVDERFSPEIITKYNQDLNN